MRYDVAVFREKPSAELQAFFRRRFNDVTFIRGSVIDIPTLNLAKVIVALTILIATSTVAVIDTIIVDNRYC